MPSLLHATFQHVMRSTFELLALVPGSSLHALISHCFTYRALWCVLIPNPLVCPHYFSLSSFSWLLLLNWFYEWTLSSSYRKKYYFYRDHVTILNRQWDSNITVDHLEFPVQGHGLSTHLFIPTSKAFRNVCSVQFLLRLPWGFFPLALLQW